jgi:YVTN family beta-propeller protein
MPLRLLNAFASGHNMSGIALSRDGTKIYRALPDEHCVDIVENATGGIIGRIEVPGSPARVEVSPTGHTAIAVGTQREPVGNRGKAYVIDLRTNRLTATIPVGLTPLSAVFSPEGRFAYISSFDREEWGGGSVYVFRTADWLQTATVFVGEWAWQAAVGPDGNYVYVSTEFAGGSLAIVDANTNEVSGYVTGMGGNPRGVAVSAGGTKVYVASFADKYINIVDTATGTAPESIDVGPDPHHLVINPDHNELYVAHNSPMGSQAGLLLVIDLTTHRIQQRIEMGSAGDMALRRDGTRLYCIDSTNDHICEFAVE